MKRKFIVLLHVGYWSVYLLLLTVMLALLRLQFRSAPSTLAILTASPIGVLAIAPNVLAFYLAYSMVTPRLLEQRRIGAAVVGGLIASIGSGLIALLVLRIWLGADQPVFSSWTESLSLLVSLAAVASIHAMIGVVMRGFVAWYGELRLKDELRGRTRDMEMALVRSKLDPHFLFNTLNNIDVLIANDPITASAYLNQLSDLLRFVLYEAGETAIPLSTELAYITKYIALERLRAVDPDFVTYEVIGDADGVMIAPMVFIPIIENAFKHTDERRTPGVVQIRVSVEGRTVSFTCWNRRSARGGVVNDADAGGLGHLLIRRRLELLYPARHTLDVADNATDYTVRLSVNLE